MVRVVFPDRLFRIVSPDLRIVIFILFRYSLQE